MNYLSSVVITEGERPQGRALSVTPISQPRIDTRPLSLLKTRRGGETPR
ncbi:hypothetical protein [Nonomuraea sp. NPDC002799]